LQSNFLVKKSCHFFYFHFVIFLLTSYKDDTDNQFVLYINILHRISKKLLTKWEKVGKYGIMWENIS